MRFNSQALSCHVRLSDGKIWRSLLKKVIKFIVCLKSHFFCKDSTVRDERKRRLWKKKVTQKIIITYICVQDIFAYHIKFTFQCLLNHNKSYSQSNSTIYIYIYICLFVCVCINELYIRIYIYTYIYIYINIWTIYIYIYICVCGYKRTIYMYYIYKYMNYIYIYIWSIYIYIYIYIYSIQQDLNKYVLIVCLSDECPRETLSREFYHYLF